MGAFNWIIINACCPVCQEQVELRCQTHVASSFDSDEATGFRNREYHLGERMAWWSRGDKKYTDWRANLQINGPSADSEDAECCYTDCPICKSELYAIIEFRDLVPINVKGVGRESEWPPGYL